MMLAKPWDDSQAVAQLLLYCTLMLLFVHPIATTAASRGAVAMPPTAPDPGPATTPAPTPSATRNALAPASALAPAPHVWNVEYILWAPDCKQHGMIGINGGFPGPNISANTGDEITVVVNNKLHTEGVVIHWHGIRQIGTPWADGTASISQCPINPGETFEYKFKADKPGTYFYHGHFGMQRAAGLYGWLIVHDPDDPWTKHPMYAGELHMLLSDWYHEAVYAQAAGLERKDDHFQWVGEPQTILINGQGQFGCTLGEVGVFQRGIRRDAEQCDDSPAVEAACDKKCGEEELRKGQDECKQRRECSKKEAEKAACEKDCETEAKTVCEDEKKVSCAKILRSECGPFCRDTQCGPVVFNVQPGKMYRLRIASTTSLSALNVQVQEHELTVVEADGNYVQQFDVPNIDIYSGESYSFLLNTTAEKKKASPYWISVGVIGREPKTLPALAILNYTDAGEHDRAAPDGRKSKRDLPTRAPPETPAWYNVSRSTNFTALLKARAGTPPPPENSAKKGGQMIFMLNTQEMDGGQIKWAINHVSLSLPATPYLGAYHYGVEDQVFDTTAEAPRRYDGSYDIGRPPHQQEPAARPATMISDRVYRFAHGDVVDVVLQNAVMRKAGVSESHPWHLHGHDFWVLGYGDGAYRDNAEDKARLNRRDPPLRNTVVLFPHGWTVIRFVADNPGVWAFHCHIEPHLHMGMGVVFAEGVEKLKLHGELKVPSEAFMCGKTAVRAATSALAPPTPPTPPSP